MSPASPAAEPLGALGVACELLLVQLELVVRPILPDFCWDGLRQSGRLALGVSELVQGGSGAWGSGLGTQSLAGRRHFSLVTNLSACRPRRTNSSSGVNGLGFLHIPVPLCRASSKRNTHSWFWKRSTLLSNSASVGPRWTFRHKSMRGKSPNAALLGMVTCVVSRHGLQTGDQS